MAAPYEVVQQVFDSALANSTALQSSATGQISSVISSLAGLTVPNNVSAPSFTVPAVSVPVITPLALPTYTIPASSVIADTFSADYVAKLNEAQVAITAKLSEFFTTYFPMSLVGGELTLAQDWVINVLTNGGAMNPEIENQYWQRDRDRIGREVAVKTSEATTNWAARGFALPPGAAVGAVLNVQRAGLEQLSQSSREVAIKKYETEVTLQQEAVKLAISLRTSAIDAMGEYIKTLVFAPRDSAQSYGSTSAAATKSANDALVAYFGATTQANINLIDAQARVSIATTGNQLAAGQMGVDAAVKVGDLQLRQGLGVADLAVRQNEVAGNWTVQIGNQRVQGALAAAQMTATMAAAQLNGIHATAGVSGSSSDSTQFYG